MEDTNPCIHQGESSHEETSNCNTRKDPLVVPALQEEVDTLLLFTTSTVQDEKGKVERAMQGNKQLTEADQQHQSAYLADNNAAGRPMAPLRLRILTHLGLQSGDLNNSSLEEITAHLDDPHGSLRWMAALALAEKKNEPAFAEMYTYIVVCLSRMAFYDEEWQVRIAAIRTLGKIALPTQPYTRSTFELLLVDRYDYRIRAATAQAIGEVQQWSADDLCSSSFIHALVAATHDKHWEVRAAIIQTIGKLGIVSLMNYIVVALEDEDSAVRVEAIQALARLDGEQARPRLVLIARQSRDLFMREAASALLQNQLSIPGEVAQAANFQVDDMQKEILPYAVQEATPLALRKEKNSRLIDLHSMRLRFCASLSDVQNIFVQRSYSFFRFSRSFCLYAAFFLVTCCIVATTFLITTPSQATPPHPDAALSRTSPPNSLITVQPGEIFFVALDAHNTGSTIWSIQDGYQLTCSRAELTECMGAQIVPLNYAKPSGTSHYSFQLHLQAPNAPGTYYLKWRMENHQGGFGQICTLEVRVISSSPHTFVTSNEESSDNAIEFYEGGRASIQLPLQTRKGK